MIIAKGASMTRTCLPFHWLGNKSGLGLKLKVSSKSNQSSFQSGIKAKVFNAKGSKNIKAESDQKDKMRHAMDDNGISSKEIHERHRERAITAEEEPDDTKPLQYVPKSQRHR
ncbi:hypothetical protein Tco_0411532 [Tanacetum coccineum]